MTQVAVTVIGTNLVMDYGTNEAAVAAMEAMQANLSEIERLRHIEQLAVNLCAGDQIAGEFEQAFAALDDALGGLDG